MSNFQMHLLQKLNSDERFTLGTWTELETGAPVLTDALVSFDCEIGTNTRSGTHSRFYLPNGCNQKNEEDQALVYFQPCLSSSG